jgi:hypothetical protein
MRAVVFCQPFRQAQKIHRGRLERTNFGRDLAVSYKAQAGHQRLFVNVETASVDATVPCLPPGLRRRRGAPVNKNSNKRAPGPMTARGDSLRCSRNPGSN